ncbi:Crp/Fnr family transcriptional regulator [Allorhizobium pseudoryzae]|uniref:Crp/Fnr family transcriptional regulator n=2 Tax=Paracoccaceae TaxID=31989 RepID=A0A8K0VBD5_9RHOB|nr:MULTISPECIES: Crp/Fnr family transcriptional regulator [Paracoccaceae]MBL4918581.1 Crp/Fnr family transcriptional regulator [Szabonella alba]MCB5412113.1 Crp/Fnr family transcriptional regulator [Pseudogemmobacter faecipullorum]
MDDWTAYFKEMDQLPAPMRKSLLRNSRKLQFPAGSRLFGPGQPAEYLLLLVSGKVRVTQVSDTGREVVLYRVGAGESCVLTSACMLAYDDLATEGLAETDVEAIGIPRATFDELMAMSPDFRGFVMRAWSRRVTDLLSLIDDIAFQRIDLRLATRLLAMAEGDTVHATHQQLAAELGSAREVISRTLSEFQRRGWIEQARGEVRLMDRPALEKLTREPEV